MNKEHFPDENEERNPFFGFLSRKSLTGAWFLSLLNNEGFSGKIGGLSSDLSQNIEYPFRHPNTYTKIDFVFIAHFKKVSPCFLDSSLQKPKRGDGSIGSFLGLFDRLLFPIFT